MKYVQFACALSEGDIFTHRIGGDVYIKRRAGAELILSNKREINSALRYHIADGVYILDPSDLAEIKALRL